jgi:antitoxin (DNA-binding transcriptional repressor) of toxin-antitoxin stability system
VKKIDVSEFKARIVELVGEVQATGETFVICENDKPFALLRPPTKKTEPADEEPPK